MTTTPDRDATQIQTLASALNLCSLEAASALARLQTLGGLLTDIPADKFSMHERFALCKEARGIVSEISARLAEVNARAHAARFSLKAATNNAFNSSKQGVRA